MSITVLYYEEVKTIADIDVDSIIADSEDIGWVTVEGGRTFCVHLWN